MATAIAVTAEDVAVELVATKMAFVSLIETLTGTSPLDTSHAAEGWATRSPVYLSLDAQRDRVFNRADVIEADMLRGIAAFLTEKATFIDSIEADRDA